MPPVRDGLGPWRARCLGAPQTRRGARSWTGAPPWVRMRILARLDGCLASHTRPRSTTLTTATPMRRRKDTQVCVIDPSILALADRGGSSPRWRRLPIPIISINIYLFHSKNYPILRGHAVKGGRSAWYPGGSAPAVRARASHGRGAGVSSIGSCASSVYTLFAATSAAIGSGASASAGARTRGPPVPGLRGRALSWSCPPRRWRPVWLVLGRSGATRQGRLPGASCAFPSLQSSAFALPRAGVQSCPGVSLPLQNPFKFLIHL
jgi:hypothetical protein